MPRTRGLLLSVLACLTACNPEAILSNDDCTFDGDLSGGVQGTLSPYNTVLPAVHAPATPVTVRVQLLGLVVNGLEVGGVCGAQVRWTPGPGSGTVLLGTTQTGEGVGDLGVASTTWILPTVQGVSATLTAEVVNSDPLLRVVFTTSTTPAPNFALSLTPQPALSIVQGASTPAATVNIARTNFTGGVTLSVLNLPTGVTASFAPDNPITGNSSFLTLTVPPATPTGVYNTLAVQGVGTTGTVTTPLTLTVTAAPVAPSFTLSLSQPALSIAQGASTPTSTVNIARTNFTGDVTLSVLNLPAGVTAAFAPANPIAGNSSVLTLTVPLATPVGVYNTLAVQGVGTAGTVTTPLTLTVTAAPAPVGLTLSILAGNNQSALVNSAVEIRPSVIVRNSLGQGVPGVSVTWQVVQGTGSFLVDAPTTDATGTSRLTYFGPTTAGTIKLRATANSVQQVSPPSVDFTITGLAP